MEISRKLTIAFGHFSQTIEYAGEKWSNTLTNQRRAQNINIKAALTNVSPNIQPNSIGNYERWHCRNWVDNWQLTIDNPGSGVSARVPCSSPVAKMIWLSGFPWNPLNELFAGIRTPRSQEGRKFRLMVISEHRGVLNISITPSWKARVQYRVSTISDE